MVDRAGRTRHLTTCTRLVSNRRGSGAGAFIYPAQPQHCNSMRIGWSSIATERIEQGIQAIGSVLQQHLRANYAAPPFMG